MIGQAVLALTLTSALWLAGLVLNAGGANLGFNSQLSKNCSPPI
jgi:hypothetical protein